MATPGNITIGQTVQLNLTYDDGHGNPSQPPANLAYAVTPAGVVTVTKNAGGASVVGIASGSFSITATADGCSPVSVSGTVALPLAAALHLAWAS